MAATTTTTILPTSSGATPPLPTLHTSRLTLTMFDPASSQDALDLLAVFNDPVHIVNAGDMGIHTPAQLHALNLALTIPNTKFTRCAPPPNMAAFGITDACIPCFMIRLGAYNPQGDFVGTVSLVQRGADAIPDMGWALLSQFSGQGYATEAAREALRYWTQECGVVDMIVTTDVGNRGSWRIAEKLGFLKVEEGVKDKTGTVHNLYYLPGGRKPDSSFVFSFTGSEEVDKEIGEKENGGAAKEEMVFVEHAG